MSLFRLAKKHHNEFGLAKWLTFTLEVASALMLFALMILTCGDVIGRYLFNNSINGTTELTELALGIIIFCQLPVITIAGTHVVVDILDRFIPDAFIKTCFVLTNVLIGIGLLFIADRVWFQALRSLKRGVVTEFLGIPTAYFIQFISIMIYVTAAILLFSAVHKLIQKVKK